MKKWSIAHRLWHWLNAFSMILLFLTILFPDDIWQYHIPLGIFIGFLFLFRILLILFGNDRKFLEDAFFYTKKLINSIQEKNFTLRNIIHLCHKIVVKISYVGVLSLIMTQMITGFLMTQKILSYEISKEIHTFSGFFIGLFILVHFIGVIIAELTDEPGIISDMIHGGQKNS